MVCHWGHAPPGNILHSLVHILETLIANILENNDVDSPEKVASYLDPIVRSTQKITKHWLSHKEHSITNIDDRKDKVHTKEEVASILLSIIIHVCMIIIIISYLNSHNIFDEESYAIVNSFEVGFRDFLSKETKLYARLTIAWHCSCCSD